MIRMAATQDRTPTTAGEDSAAAEMVADEACCPPLLGPTLDDADAAELAAVLKALADPVRLKLVNLIAKSGEACACDLPMLLDRTQPTISHHLSILVKAGVLAREQRGKWAWFSLRPARLSALCDALGSQACLPDR
jgi:ArsR family transcriptional regulator